MRLMAPVSAPGFRGLKNTVTVHVNPAGKLEPHVFCCMKSALATMLEKLSGPLPVLFNDTVSGALFVPTAWVPNLRLDGLNDTSGDRPMPVRAMVCGVV